MGSAGRLFRIGGLDCLCECRGYVCSFANLIVAFQFYSFFQSMAFVSLLCADVLHKVHRYKRYTSVIIFRALPRFVDG